MTNDSAKFAELLSGCSTLPPMENDRPPLGTLSSSNATAKPARGVPKKPAKGKAGQRETRKRFEILNAFADFTASGLPRSELLVWLMLYRDTRDGIARTPQVGLARRTRLAKRTVCLAIERLKKRGLLIVTRQGGLNRGPSSYIVLPIKAQ